MSFTATLFKWPGKGGWTFVSVPDTHAPEAAGPWGRTPVLATVDGLTWRTSAWRDREHGWLLPVPAKVRRGKHAGDTVEVDLEPP